MCCRRGLAARCASGKGRGGVHQGRELHDRHGPSHTHELPCTGPQGGDLVNGPAPRLLGTPHCPTQLYVLHSEASLGTIAFCQHLRLLGRSIALSFFRTHTLTHRYTHTPHTYPYSRHIQTDRQTETTREDHREDPLDGPRPRRFSRPSSCALGRSGRRRPRSRLDTPAAPSQDVIRATTKHASGEAATDPSRQKNVLVDDVKGPHWRANKSWGWCQPPLAARYCYRYRATSTPSHQESPPP